MGGTEKYVQPGVSISPHHLRKEIKARPEDQRAVAADGRCSLCNTEVTPPGNFCTECGAVFVKEKGRASGRETQFLASSGGKVVMEPPGESGSGWDTEVARVVDVRGMEEVPGKGYVKKEEEK